MAKKVCLVMLFLVASFLLFGCSYEPGKEPQKVSNPNVVTINLDCGQKLIEVTWHPLNPKPWVLTRPMRNGEMPESYKWVDAEKAYKLYLFVECSVEK